jgi:hypothetical protein
MKPNRTSLIAAIAIGLLVASTIGVAAQADDPMAPSFFSGDGGLDASYTVETSETRLDGVVAETFVLSARWASNDPRIDGLMTNSGVTLDYRLGALSDSATGVTGVIGSSLVRVINDDGAWEGTLDSITMEDDGTDQVSGWLVGEDAYEGLMAYVMIDYNSPCCMMSGHITPESPPSVPDELPEQ